MTLLLAARRAIFGLLVCVPLGACTMVGAVPAGPSGPMRPAGPETAAGGAVSGPERAKGHPAESATPGEGSWLTAEVVALARESIGTPYRWGGTDENGFDCSGLIQFAYGEVGIALPRTSAAQIRAGSPVATRLDRLQPGDILGFSNGGGPKTEHVGLYLGGHEFIHSSSRGVRISSLRNGYWQERLVAARRVVD